MKPRYAALAGLVALNLLVGFAGSFATISSVGSWYAGLSLPSWRPPNALFGPVWTTLYVLMGVAAWRVRRAGIPWDSVPFRLYFGQLLLNLAWSFLFFGLRSPLAGLVDILLLLLLIAATAVSFGRIDRWAAILFLPYLAWVAFASVLNFAIWRMNP